MPYASLGQICGGRQGLDGRLVTLIGLYLGIQSLRSMHVGKRYELESESYETN